MGQAFMTPGPSTSLKQPEHQVYPYLLRGIEVGRPDRVRSANITYVRLARGFVYPVVISSDHRRVFAAGTRWRLSNSLDTSFFVDCREVR